MAAIPAVIPMVSDIQMPPRHPMTGTQKSRRSPAAQRSVSALCGCSAPAGHLAIRRRHAAGVLSAGCGVPRFCRRVDAFGPRTI
jgi:hypothetical protein